MSLDLLIIVFVFGAIGSLLRFALTSLWPARSGRIPLGVLLANWTGSLIGGTILGLLGTLMFALGYLLPIILFMTLIG